MVLGLPLLLLLFALMINASFTGVWKLRLLGASREVAWRSRDPRSNNLPNPKYQSTFWTQPDHPTDTPLTSETSGSSPLNIQDLGSYAAVRDDVGTLKVDKNLLDPKRGVFQGTSDVSRQFPLLPDGLQPLHGSPTHHLTDNCFPFWKTHLASNRGRRTKILYGEWFSNASFKSVDTAFANPPGGSNRGIGQIEYGNDWQNYEFAVGKINDSLFNDNLLPLGGFHVQHSNQLKYTKGHYHDPEVDVWAYPIGDRNLKPRPPQFMPPIGHFISSDANAVRDQHVTPIIEQIDDDPNALVDDDPNESGNKSETEGNLPHTLAEQYIDFFEACINLPVNGVNDFYQDSPGHSSYEIDMNAAEAEKDRRAGILEPVIQQLQAYQSKF